MRKDRESINRDRRLIMEMIDASWELAEKKGLHDLEPGCNCIVCINKRKRIIDNAEENICAHLKHTDL
jgi:hypothetical protein